MRLELGKLLFLQEYALDLLDDTERSVHVGILFKRSFSACFFL